MKNGPVSILLSKWAKRVGYHHNDYDAARQDCVADLQQAIKEEEDLKIALLRLNKCEGVWEETERNLMDHIFGLGYNQGFSNGLAEAAELTDKFYELSQAEMEATTDDADTNPTHQDMFKLGKCEAYGDCAELLKNKTTEGS